MSTKLTSLIIARKEEQKILEQLFDSKNAEFMAIFGRRRIGKTYLIKCFFKKKPCVFFRITGVKNGLLSEQLYEFTRTIEQTFYRAGTNLKEPKSWMHAFEMLTTAINEYSQQQKIVLFFDEVPWLATKRSRFLQALDYYWNTKWSDNSKVKLIICGSAASWIIKNIINNKGGLHNRITRQIKLEPFTLNETKEFLEYKKIRLTHQQILSLYMVMGGIPHYLNHVEKGLSAVQIIDTLCFARYGILFQEFNNLFSSLFDKSETHLEFIRIIGKHRNGIERKILLKQIKSQSGGRINLKLTELEEAGFIDSFVPYGHTKRGISYRICDEYTLFYLHWIEPNKQSIRRKDKTPGYWEEHSRLPSYKAWSGYAFEAICYKHLAQIRQHLKISAGADVGSWHYSPRSGSKDKGAQIDLLFDRTDGAITICEIKYCEHEFAIDKKYSTELLNKINVYQKQTHTNKQIFLAMITSAGLKPSMYSEEVISQTVEIENLFDN